MPGICAAATLAAFLTSAAARTAVPPPARAASDPAAPSIAAVPAPAAAEPPGPGPIAAGPVAADWAPPIDPVPAPSSSRRPRFDVAVGMGISLDSNGLIGGRTVIIPAFQIAAGIGSGLIGFMVRLQASQGSGRHHQMQDGMSDMPLDRQAVDLLLALRPLVAHAGTDWSQELLRSITLTAGLGAENAAAGTQAARRFGLSLGVHADLVTLSDGQPGGSDLRARIGLRRMLAGEKLAGAVPVTDSGLEAIGSLAVVF